MCSCSFLPEELQGCEVNFYVDGELYATEKVTIGQTVSEPKAPKKENQIFVEWGTNAPIFCKYDFSKKVMGNIDLHARFALDAVSMTNMITQQTMKSIVTIENKCYNNVSGSLIEINSEVAQGSGVVVDISGGYCYVLTNCHVVEKPEKYASQTFTIEDAWGNTYSAHLYRKNSKFDYAMSQDYDLALLYFEYLPTDKNSLEEIRMGNDPKKNDYVAALGTPAGLQNAITYGTVIEYQKVKAGTDESLKKITFDVIVHNAPIDHGSSGGALVNTSGQLVGINFAGYGDGAYGCSIPISKVMEFMNIFVY